MVTGRPFEILQRRRHAINTMAACFLACAIGVSCKRSSPPHPHDTGVTSLEQRPNDTEPIRPDHISTSDDPEGLKAHWNAGPFATVDLSQLANDVSTHLQIDLAASITPVQQHALQDKIAAFLRVYATVQLDDYKHFRGERHIAQDDDPRVAQRIKLFSSFWDNNKYGPLPTNAEEVLTGAWKLYATDPVITSINWDSLRARVRRIERDHLIRAEWDEWAGFESHFYKEFLSSRRASISVCMPDLLLPNSVSVESLSREFGYTLFADCEVIKQSGGSHAFPILFRLVWNNLTSEWMPLFAFTLDCSGPRFVW